MPKAGTPIVRTSSTFSPRWTTRDGQHVKLYLGNVTEVLAKLPEKSVHCCVTSPPYWGLRDYGVEGQLGSEPSPDCKTEGQAQCGRCFVCSMVAVFRGVRQVLRDDGTCWINLGDTYNANVGSGFKTNAREGHRNIKQGMMIGESIDTRGDSGLKPGNLVGVPWRVALALQADGWILRQDIIWHKPAPMPESVRNRCTKAHEYVFLFAKKQGYYYDAEAIKEESSWESTGAPVGGTKYTTDPEGVRPQNGRADGEGPISTGRANKRSVWTVSSSGYKGAHFATFPTKLITPCILAGTSEKGCCAKCGAPWERIVEEKTIKVNPVANGVRAEWDRQSAKNWVGSSGNQGLREGFQEKEYKTAGWEPTCKCDSEVIPCTVLDPFIGSGTTCCVSIDNGRRSIGIDLSEKYLTQNAIPRIEGVLLKRPETSSQVIRIAKAVTIGKVAARSS